MSAVYGLENLRVKGLGEFTIDHRRRVVDHRGEEMTVSRAESRGPNYVVLPHGGDTEVTLTLADGRVYRAVARCSAEDNFSYREGANQAAARLLLQYAFDNYPKRQITRAVLAPGGYLKDAKVVKYLVSADAGLATNLDNVMWLSWNPDGGEVIDARAGQLHRAVAAYRADQVEDRLKELKDGFDPEFFCPHPRAARYRKTGEVLAHE